MALSIRQKAKMATGTSMIAVAITLPLLFYVGA